MKHSWKVTFVILAMFFIAQLIGLLVINIYHPTVTQEVVNGTISNVTTYHYPYGMNPPQDTTPRTNLYSIIIAIAFAVILMLVLMKFHIETLLRFWFFFVIAIALAITLNAFLIKIPYAYAIALTIGLIFAFIKIFQRNIMVHNLTELLIYPGIASIFVPLLDVFTASILLIIISIYDIYAVWHAGFMQKMAKYQIQKLRIFSGFFVPYLSKDQKNAITKQKTKGKGKKLKVNVAILGGGDVVFPIIVAGVVLMTFGFWWALLVSIGATIALAALFYMSEKGKFYPAMPFISVGCFIALAIVYLFH